MDPLPSEDVLCNKYQISKITVKKALEDLKNEGYILRIKRKGTFVNFQKRQTDDGTNFKIGKKTIAFIVPDIEDVFVSEIYSGIETIASKNGYEVITFSSTKIPERENANIEFLVESDIKGAIIFPYWGRFNVLQILKLKKKNFPFVLIDRYFRDVSTNMVVVDNFQGAYKAVKYLVKIGHTKIAHIMGVDCTANEDRFEGYRSALEEAEIPFNSSLVKKIQPFETEGSLRFEPDDVGGYNEAKILFSQKEKPTAVFAGNDYIALGCYKAAKELKRKIPQDLSIIGFDDLKFASNLEVPLTTVKQPKYEIGSKACEVLMKKITRQGKVEKIVLPTELIIRESSKGLKNSIKEPTKKGKK
jgi:DNA-binding LacI/PurR family transcriptional regulator